MAAVGNIKHSGSGPLLSLTDNSLSDVIGYFCQSGLTGGLAAPLVAAGAATIIGSAGAAVLGSTAGIAIMASLFGAAGAGLTGKYFPWVCPLYNLLVPRSSLFYSDQLLLPVFHAFLLCWPPPIYYGLSQPGELCTE